MEAWCVLCTHTGAHASQPYTHTFTHSQTHQIPTTHTHSQTYHIPTTHVHVHTLTNTSYSNHTHAHPLTHTPKNKKKIIKKTPKTSRIKNPKKQKAIFFRCS